MASSCQSLKAWGHDRRTPFGKKPPVNTFRLGNPGTLPVIHFLL